MTATIQKHAGTYCVADPQAMHSEPTEIVNYWPVVEQLAIDDDDIGRRLDYSNGGGGPCWSFKRADGFAGVWVNLHLPQGGRTEPIHRTKRDIPRPKCRVETRYRDGGGGSGSERIQ